MTLDDAPDILKVCELADVLRCGRDAAYELVNSGRVWSVKVGNRIRIPKAAVRRFLGETTTAGEDSIPPAVLEATAHGPRRSG